MTFKDIIKSSVYQGLIGGGALTAGTVLFILITAALVGIYIYIVYKMSAKAAFYSKDINVVMAGLPIVVAAIMIAMQSNLIVSLGMVGALSIVRFRNAIKNPLDLLYLFWSISAGIISGIGLYLLAVMLCVIMTVVIVGLYAVPNMKSSSVLVIRTTEENVDFLEIESILKKNASSVKEKARCCRQNETEIIYELRPNKKEQILLELKKQKGVVQIHFLSHDGEYRI